MKLEVFAAFVAPANQVMQATRYGENSPGNEHFAGVDTLPKLITYREPAPGSRAGGGGHGPSSH